MNLSELKFLVERKLYKNLLKPILFRFDAEAVHNGFTTLGEFLGSSEIGKTLTRALFAYSNPVLEKEVYGLKFQNPLGLAAGFDYDGHLVEVMKSVGFGFNTVGTVTAKPYEGNPKPRLARLPESKSLLVNKGFKSQGADAVARRLDSKKLDDIMLGLSVGSSNIPEVNSISSAIDDYLYTFNKFKNKTYVKYFELNISCPNTAMTENFTRLENFQQLVAEVSKLNISKPIFVKMPNEVEFEKIQPLITSAMGQGIRGFIFSNLVKDRSNTSFDQNELLYFKDRKGNFSGAPTEEKSLELISAARNTFGNDIFIIGCGGVMDILGVGRKLSSGADLVQFVSGMVFEGPQLAGEMCYRLRSV